MAVAPAMGVLIKTLEAPLVASVPVTVRMVPVLTVAVLLLLPSKVTLF